MVHRLPPASLVDRIDVPLPRSRTGRRVVHVGFVDAGCQTLNEQSGAWLHEHLAAHRVGLVGLDLDTVGVDDARRRGYEAYAVDCRDVDAVRALGLPPADLVIAGEVIEHLDDPGSFLDGLHALVAPGGLLVVTTPNASGLVNAAALLGNLEINHPDHVVLYTWTHPRHHARPPRLGTGRARRLPPAGEEQRDRHPEPGPHHRRPRDPRDRAPPGAARPPLRRRRADRHRARASASA